MKRSSTLFLQGIIVLIGMCALAFMLWEPWMEGVNANSDFVHIYFDDPFLAYAYIASIPFFVALFQAFKLLGYIEGNKVFSRKSVKALRYIKYSAITLIGSIVLGELFIMMSHGEDDSAGIIALGIVTTFITIVIAAAAAVFEKLLQNVVEIKSENDLTV